MANIKFSAFTTETDPTQIDFLAGYQGATMKKIAPSNLGSVTSLNDLSDVSIDLTNDSAYFINIPAGLSGATGNLVIGESAGNALTSGDKNIAIGFRAMNEKTVGSDNIAIGYDANRYPAANSNAVAIGTEAVFNATGNDVIGIGFQAGYAGNQDGSVSIGTSAHGTGFNANDAVAIGNVASYSGVATGSVVIGKRAGFIGNDKTNSVLIGFDAGRAVNSASNNTVSIGYQAGYSQTSGTSNTNIGYQAGRDNTTNSSRTFIGDEAGLLQTGGFNTGVGRYALRQGTGLNNTAVGVSAMVGNNFGGSFNTAVGQDCLSSNGDKAGNAVLGCSAGRLVTTGDYNTLLGYQAGDSLTTGSNNIVIGYAAAASAVGVSNEITLGDANITALRIPGLQSGASDGDVLTFSSGTGVITLQAAGGGGGSYPYSIDGTSLYSGFVPGSLSGSPAGNTILGIDAGLALTTGSSNTLLGHDAGKAINTAVNNTIVGFNSGISFTNQTGNTVVGMEAGLGTTAAATTIGWLAGSCGNYAVTVGHQAARFGSSAYSIFIGEQAGYNAGGGDGTIGIGNDALRVNTATASVAMGRDAGYSNTSGDKNIYIGFEAGYDNTTNNGQTYIGYQAGKFLKGGTNTVIGSEAAGPNMTNTTGTGNNNVYIGQDAAGSADARRSGNVYLGVRAGQRCHSNNQVAIGLDALGFTSTSFSQGGNIAIGYKALQNNDATERGIAIGYECMNAANTGDHNIALGGIIHNGDIITGDDNIMIGYDTNLSALSVSNEVNIYNGSVTARFQGAAAAWSFVSDARDKKDIEDLKLGLDFVTKLKPRKFKWDLRDSDVDKNKEASGFIAQEVIEALDEVNADYTGIVDTNNSEQYTVSQANIIPMLVNSIKELKEEIEQLKKS